MAFDYASKVRGLLAKADSAQEMGNDHEAESYRATAMRIMRDYQIAEEEAIAVDPSSVVPTHITVEFNPNDWSLAGYFPLMLQAIARHTGIRVEIMRIGLGQGYRATLVGYEGDLRYAEFLWTSAHLMFSTRVSPVWSDSRSEEENIFLLRNSGIERRVIADKAWGNGHEASARSKVQRIYVKEANRRGEVVRAAGLGFDTKAYREAYAQSFLDTLTTRLRVARDAADSTGGGLVLHGRSERVQEAFYELFPNRRPSTDPAVPYEPANKDCAKCEKAASGFCREHNWLKPRTWTQADEARHYNRLHGASARAGRQSGRDAAEGVVIQRGHTTANRLDASGRAIEG